MTTARSVSVHLNLNVTGFIAGVSTAQLELRRLAASMDAASGKGKKSWDTAGKAISGFGLAAGGALAAASKAAIDWETAWAGVTKTVDGSTEQMGALEEQLRNLAKTLPATHEQIAAVAEAAGQLGVSREGIVSFTRTMIDLSETTNLSADEAATAIAQFANVMGTQLSGADTEVDNLGAALVALGNDGASTERDIIFMAQRIAGAGKLVGASESDVLALSNALASVGISAELGGGAVSRVLQDIYAASKEGGDALDGFAQVAGVSAGDFARAFSSDPVAALDQFVGGLNGVEASGGNVIGTLKDLGIKSTEEVSTLLRLKGAGDLLSDSLQLGNDAWKANTALVAEAAKRYETAGSKIKVAKNNLNDAGISLGETFLPAISAAADGVSDFAGVISGLLRPVQQTGAALLGVTSAAGLSAGGFLLLFPRVMDTVEAFRDLKKQSPGTASSLSNLGKAAGFAGAAFVALEGLDTLTSMHDYSADVDKLTTSMRDLGNETLRAGGKGGKGLGDLDLQAKKLFSASSLSGGDKFNSILEDMTGYLPRLGTSSDKATDAIGHYDEAIARLVTEGNTDQAAAVFERYGDVLRLNGATTQEVTDLFPKYGHALADVASKQDAASVSAKPLADGLIRVKGAAGGATLDVKKFGTALDELFASTFSVEAATDSWRQGLVDVSRAAKDNGKSLTFDRDATDKHKEAVLANREAMRQQVQRAYDLVEAYGKTGKSAKQVADKSKALKDEFIKQAVEAGFSRTAAKKYAEALDDIPGTYKANLEAVDGVTPKVAVAKTALESLQGKTITTYLKSITTKSTRTAPDQGGIGALLDPNHAQGGYISGPGTPTSDSIPAMLSDGEYVVRASAVKAVGTGLLDSINRYAAGGLVRARGYAAGGEVEGPDFSSILGRIPTSTPSKGDVADLRLRKAKATTALHAAESALHKVEKDRHHTSRQLAAAEERVANAEGTRASASRKLTAAEKDRTAAAKPYASRFHTAAVADNASTAAFLRNVDTLRRRGYTTLADQFTTDASPEAYKLAAAAVASTKTARTLTSDLNRSAGGQGGLASRQAAIGSRNEGNAAWASFRTAATGDAATQKAFLADVTKLADKGYGALAQQLLAMGPAEGRDLAARALKLAAKDAADLNRGFAQQTAQDKATELLPATLAIKAALAGAKNPTIAAIAAASGLSTSDLQAAAIAMKTSLGGNSNARALMAGLNVNSSYVGGFGQQTQSGTPITVQVTSTGNPWRDGEKAAAGAKRVLAVGSGRRF